MRNLFAKPALQIFARRRRPLKESIKMNKTEVKTAAPSAGFPLGLVFAAAGIALAWLAVPLVAHGQGIVRGAQQGAYEGRRAAGPVGEVVGGAVGAGVGGAMGAVQGVLGIPYGHHYRCRGFHDRHGRFRCYR
jgi:hypothetical protein